MNKNLLNCFCCLFFIKEKLCTYHKIGKHREMRFLEKYKKMKKKKERKREKLYMSEQCTIGSHRLRYILLYYTR